MADRYVSVSCVFSDVRDTVRGAGSRTLIAITNNVLADASCTVPDTGNDTTDKAAAAANAKTFFIAKLLLKGSAASVATTAGAITIATVKVRGG